MAHASDSPVIAPASVESSADAVLVAAARRGDRSALGALHDRYARVVRAVVLTIAPPDLADDIAQETFLNVLRRLPQLRADESFGGWVVSIARSRAIDAMRSRRPVRELTHEHPARSGSDADARARADDVMRVVRGLPEAYRLPLVLRLVERMSGPQIAARTGLTEGSVRVNLHRGFTLLKEALGPEGHP